MIRTLWSDDVELRVDLGVGRADDTTFTLDHDPLGRLDGTGTLGSPDAPYDDRTCDVRRLTWRAGATRTDGVLTRWEAGSATIVLDNRDGAYDFAAPNTRLLPMIPVRIRARYAPNDIQPNPEWLPMFYGFADQWNATWEGEDAIVTLVVSDGVKLLAKYDGPEQDPPVGAGDTAAQRVVRILDEAEWTQPRRVSAGGRIMQATSMAQDAWTQLLLNQDAELGATYVDKDGALVFLPRNLWVDQTSGAEIQAAFGPTDLRYEHATVNNDDVNYKNIVDGARTGGTERSARDQAQVNTFQPHRYGRNDLPFASDVDVNDWINVVLQTSLSLAPRVDALVVLPQVSPEGLWPIVLETAYGDRWQVRVDPPFAPTDIVRRVQVRGWEHDVSYESWRVTYALSDAQLFQPFQLDSTDDDARLDIMRLV